MIHPSIDILGGRVVQLRGGNPDDCKVAIDDVFGVAESFHRAGELAVIDLDAALGRGDNLELIAALCERFDCRVGGGIRDHDRADRLLRAGARKLIIGTQATPEFLGRYPRERLIVALDARAGRVVDHGWTRATGDTVLDRARALEAHCSEFLYTLVDREGSLGGIDLDAVEALVRGTRNRIVAAGGIASVAEIVALERMGASCQLGMSIYTGVVKLADAIVETLDWSKHDGLLPVVVQDQARQVVMHAWADREALQRTLDSGDAWYWSRSRQELWRKGATSGHGQRVVAVRSDCDHDTLVYQIEQTGRACHVEGQYSCFGSEQFGLERLMATLEGRARQAADDAASGSYSARLMREPGLAEAKILEEAAELAEATDRREIVWEAADVLFFTLAKLAREGIPLQAVLRELDGRQGRRRAGDGGMVAASSAAAAAAAPAPAVATVAARGMAGAGADPAKVAALLREAQQGGDAALLAMTERFDRVRPPSLVVPRDAWDRAWQAMPAADRDALTRAHRNIAAVAAAQRAALGAFELEVEPGVSIGQRVVPVRRVACYVPAGRHPLPSTVLMTVTPAQVAGCAEIVVFSPPGPDGLPHPAILAAARLAGATEVVALGGVQAVAAAAYGSQSVAPCDLLVGPGNAWVTEAKRQVFGVLGLDGVAGPSEVLILADDSADPARVAADLLAQAEHDDDARAMLVTTDAALPARVAAAIELQLQTLPTAATAREAIARSPAPLVVADVDALVAAADRAAPEHLHLHLRDADAVAARVRCYGAVFVGSDASEVFGDYCAGGNHVLPTAGAARFTGGLSVATFVRLAASQRMTADGAAALAPVAARLGRLEGLEAHARAAEQRAVPAPIGRPR